MAKVTVSATPIAKSPTIPKVPSIIPGSIMGGHNTADVCVSFNNAHY